MPTMQEPFMFPTLKSLDVMSPQDSHGGMNLNDILFLSSGGLVPHLQHLQLETLSFLALPMLLCSATNHLTVTLRLWETPRFRCFLPEAIVTVLSTMTNSNHSTLLDSNRISLFLTRKPTPVFANTLFLPRPHIFHVQGRKRIPGGPHGSDRYSPITRLLGSVSFQPTQLPHVMPFPVHQSRIKVPGTL